MQHDTYAKYDTIRYDTVYLRALKSWRDGQLSLAYGTETKKWRKTEKQVPPVYGTNGYPHMPILRPLAVRRFVRLWASVSKVPQNRRFPAQDADKPPCKIWRR